MSDPPPNSKKSLDSSVTPSSPKSKSNKSKDNDSSSRTFESRFQDGPTFRSVGVADRRAQLGGVGPGGLSFEPRSSSSVIGHGGPSSGGGGRDFGAYEFQIPTDKSRSVGSTFTLPSASATTSTAPLKRKGAYKRSASTSDVVTAGAPPGVEGVEGSLLLSATAFGTNCRAVLPPLPLHALTAALGRSLTALSCDYEFIPSRAKYKVVQHKDCEWVHFVMQVFKAGEGGDQHVLEAARREGCSVAFGRVWRGIKESIANLRTTTTFTPPPAPNLNLTGPADPDLQLTPYVEMLSGAVIDQHLYASQVLARVCSSSTARRRAVAGQGDVVSAMVECANRIDPAGPLPLQNATLSHLAYALALISEDHLSHPSLYSAGAFPLLLRVSCGCSPSSPSAFTAPTLTDLSARREAARALANVCTMNDRSFYLPSLGSGDCDLAKWCEWVEGVEDEKLRIQCKRVKAKVGKA